MLMNHFSTNKFKCLRRPNAVAKIKGGPLAPNLTGMALFYQLEDQVFVITQVQGMPLKLSDGSPSGFHGYHIHEKGDCTIVDPTNPFLQSGGHYNPTNQPHPFHAGDLSQLLAVNGPTYGSAYSAITTNRFKVTDIIGLSLIIHEHSDDFMTQPTGNAGKRWACGIIRQCCYWCWCEYCEWCKKYE